jgi:hypothetical protein
MMCLSAHNKLLRSRYTAIRVFVWVAVLLSTASTVVAQQISFGINATEGIILEAISGTELDFNNKQRIITPGTGRVVISRDVDSNAFVVPFEIIARDDLDIEVTITSPLFLELEGWTSETNDPAPQIPFQVAWAFWNMNPGSGGTTPPWNDMAVISGSREVRGVDALALGISSAIFPMRRRMTSNAPPPPPPTPRHGEIVYPTTTAYLYIYGGLGPIPLGTASGQYSGIINIEVGYASYLP